ncbi:MAG: hypothetical protein OEZ34_09640 [Spirochaetia bacterium]|nr:hypothetical protein [Spirochaetia bacterium]
MKYRFYSIIFGFIFALIFAEFSPSDLRAQDEGDQGRVNYEIGMSYLLRGDRGKAKPFFEKARMSGGESADLASLELVRIMGKDSDASELRQIITAVENQDFAPKMWMAAIESLIEHQKYDFALELSIEMSILYPDSPLTDDILYMSGEVFYRKRAIPSAIEKLYQVLQNYKDSDHADDACFLLSKIYGEGGYYYSATMEYYMLKYFMNHLHIPAFKNSIWREMVKMKLEERYPSAVNS